MMITNNNNNKFFPWFVGFCDAECSFITNLVPRINKHNIITSYRVSYRIQMGLHIKDKVILEHINLQLGGIGKIYDYPIKQESTLCFITFEAIEKVIEDVFSKYPLLTSYQATRYERLRKGVMEKINKVNCIDEFNSILLVPVGGYIETSQMNCSQFYLDHWLVGFLSRRRRSVFYSI
uniref:LAGLIDADG homing endonuclease n=1 Tax=Termitomyces sp. TaxID=1916073 RepID=A0A386TYF2_9AGAR|nr:LAGLIDADG homing endonuclease [Termitomyces sp.]AYE93264.1 LAGLIDADG homing endonuclease [Termitomyces sp.]